MSLTMAKILVEEGPIWGIRLERRGDKLVISPASKCPTELKELLREHKLEILSLLEAEADGLPADCSPWLHVARQVLDGEFDGADGSTRESVFLGLRSIGHPLCKQALERLAAVREDQ